MILIVHSYSTENDERPYKLLKYDDFIVLILKSLSLWNQVFNRDLECFGNSTQINRLIGITDVLFDGLVTLVLTKIWRPRALELVFGLLFCFEFT